MMTMKGVRDMAKPSRMTIPIVHLVGYSLSTVNAFILSVNVWKSFLIMADKNN